jgi:hypothetical protein
MTTHAQTVPQEERFIALSQLPTAAIPITKRHAQRLRSEHRVPSYKIGGRVQFKEADLIAYIEQNRTEGP